MKAALKLVLPQYKIAVSVEKATRADRYILVPAHEYAELARASIKGGGNEK